MKRSRKRALGWLAGLALSSFAVPSCIGSTGGDLLEFQAYVAGAEGAANGQYTFSNDRGFEVTLSKATLHLGAIYLNQSVPTSVSSDTSCALAGIYVAEVFAGIDLDALDPEPLLLPNLGVANTDTARTAEVWLSSGDINAPSDPTVVAEVEGVASKAGEEYPFSGRITISKNRAPVATDPAQPGSKPICKQRIVTPISVELTPSQGGELHLRVDPAGWFGNVDFAELEQVEQSPAHYEFQDDDSDAPSRNLYAGIRANSGVYSIEWHAGANADD